MPREAQIGIERWGREWNDERPHGALGQMLPAQFARDRIAGAEPAG